jgi:putative ABC transport system permease protein
MGVQMTILDDARHALRQLRTRPLFAALVTATIAVSLGLGTAAFSLFDAILMRPLPYPGSGDLVRLYTFSAQAPDSLHGASLADRDDWQQGLRTLGPLAARATMETRLTRQGPARLVRTAFVTPELLDVLGVQPLLGRTFRHDENVRGRPFIAFPVGRG